MEGDKLLIIDDDPRNIFALQAVLKARGFPVVSASSAMEGIKILQEQSGFKVVLLDMMMPEMDGYEAIGEIKKLEHSSVIKIIAVTAQAMVGDREKCLAAGADGYVSKPIDVDVLLNLVQ
ncbi:response regulator [Aridibaculum aurantiacum]|uniref:response regulator n=1 Tax=Aridibaculum aurantiacum TaxID=2810307 RepID=UPI001A979134|nr:response regulator [Aridibaculum aurantiacum]